MKLLTIQEYFVIKDCFEFEKSKLNIFEVILNNCKLEKLPIYLYSYYLIYDHILLQIDKERETFVYKQTHRKSFSLFFQ